MKKRAVSVLIILYVNIFLLFAGTLSVKAEAGKEPEKNKLYARAAVLMDADSGRILFEKDARTPMPNASTTKILTCILALENGNPNNLVKVSSYAASMPDVQLHIKEGEFYRLEDLLYSLMLESHNDSAVAIAEHIGGSVDAFSDMMNEKAAQIGCKNFYFITPNGLDAAKDVCLSDGTKKMTEHSVSAADLALLMSYCIKKSEKKDEFLKITRTPSYSFSNQIKSSDGNVTVGERTFCCNNHNAFLHMMDGALSGKTGFTGKAGYCYVGALERDGKTLVAALLACGWPNHKTYKWSDMKTLMEYGLSDYQKKDFSELPLKKEWEKPIPIENAKTERLFQTAEMPVTIESGTSPTLLMKQGEKVNVRCSVKNRLKAPIKKGQEVGEIRYILDETVYWRRKICAAKEMEERDFAWYFRQTVQGFLLA